jgi:hypothetical protein
MVATNAATRNENYMHNKWRPGAGRGIFPRF